MSNETWLELSDPQRFERTWSFKNFKTPWEFVNLVADHAEKVNHHPEVSFGWGYLKLAIFSHDKKSLTQRDRDFVIAVDKLWEQFNV